MKANKGKNPMFSYAEKAKKKLEAGQELSPLELESLDNKWLSSYIAKQIEKCAGEIGKKPHEVIWLDFREFINFGYGKNSAGIAKKALTRCGGFNVVRDAYFPPEAFPEAEERSLLKRTAEMNRKYASQEIYDNLFLARIKEIVDRAYGTRRVRVPRFLKPRKGGPVKRILNVLLSDFHYQSQLKLADTGHAYGSKEEARRTAKLCKTIAEYKLDHRNETKLNLYLDGDVIQGQLHDLRDGSPLAEQACAATHLLAQMVAYLSSAFPEVEVYCATGNHGRNTARHKDRATREKWDSVETIIYYGVKRATSHIKNVVGFHIPRTPWFEVSALGHKFFGTHGDGFFNPGNPSKNINVGSLENQSNRWNAALPDTDEYRVFMVGHVHTPTASWLANGACLLVNGALCPTDGFAQSLPVPESTCGQWMFETTKSHPVGDLRLITVSKADDEDESLDKIIKPFEDF